MKRTQLKKDFREKIKMKYGGKCAYCGCILHDKFHVDHIKAFAANGDSSLENLNPSCFICNNWKFTFSLEQFRRELSYQVDRARQYSRNFRMAEKFGLIVETKEPVEFFFEKWGKATTR